MNNEKLYNVNLNYNELILLEGKVSEEVQKVIEIAKLEQSIGFELPVMNEIIREAEKNGKLTWVYKQIRSCDYCDKKYDYYRYTRNTRYHNKGEKNYDRPKYYRGIKFNEGFVSFHGHGDMCAECCSKHNVIERLVKYIIDEDLKIEIQKNDFAVTKYLKDDIRVCYSCGEEMKESEMIKEINETYPSGCPKCGAKSTLFGRNHKITNKFDHRLNPKFNEKIFNEKM